MIDQEANDTAAEFFRAKIRADGPRPGRGRDAAARRAIPFGTKRICVDTDYYETFNRDNVTLVDVREDADRGDHPDRRAHGETRSIRSTASCSPRGFDAMTGALLAIDIRGPGRRTLREKWSEGPRTYLGLAIAGFPNLFTITGPGSPSVFSNMVVSIEQHVDWIADCLERLRADGVQLIEADQARRGRVGRARQRRRQRHALPGRNSWYMGANVPGKPRVFMPYVGGVGAYRQKCDEVAANGYEGFQLIA